MRDRFYMYHPVTNLLYFAVVLCSIMLTTNPIIIIIGLINGLIYLMILKKVKYVCKLLILLFIMVLAISLINPIYNNRGITPIFTLPSGNKITYEALFFGFVCGLRLSAIIVWATCFNHIFTSDKHMYIFGKIIPVTSLVISIALSFIPRFIKTFKEIYNNLRHIYKSRFRALVKAISATVSYSFESSVHTSESMKARGFLGGRRSVYTIYKITLKDVIYIVLTLVFLCISIYGYVGKHLTYIYYPRQMYEKDGAIRYALLVLFAVETLMISSTSGFVRKGKYETDRD